MNAPAGVRYIDSPDLLNECLQFLNEHSVIAIDTEFIRERTYYPELCLIQIAAGDSIWCIDTLAIEDLSSLFKVLGSPSRQKVFHAARQDLEIFFNETKQIPAPLFDTQIAAALLGRPDQIAYAGLVAEFYELDLDKSASRTNWAQRPLSTRQLDYAADDVRYLEGVKRRLDEELDAKGRSGWLAEECLRLTELPQYENDPATAWRRVKGISKLDTAARGIAAGLAAWRERSAQQRNLPRGWVIKDDRLLAIARAAPISSAELRAIDGLAPGLLRRHGSEILATVQAPATGLSELDDLSLPRLKAAGKALLQELLDELRKCAQSNQVSSSLIATRRDLESALCGRTAIRLYGGWRNELIGDSVRNQIESNSNRPLHD